MEVKLLDGIIFRLMLINGLKYISKQEKIINELNVFPVPDGDTGSNMRLTLENGIVKSTEVKSIGEFCSSLARGMLLGARGNSGVILSQLFKGLSLSFLGLDEVSAKDYANALIKAYETAYDAVVKPTEGTILTVAREAIENIYNQITPDTTINELLTMYYNEMRISLTDTPNKLKVLKEAGVLDSGGTGLVVIYDGMIKYLNCQEDIADIEYAIPKIKENNSSEFGYCTEFILDINYENKAKFDKQSFISMLDNLGESIVVSIDDNIVKVHVHTLTPGNVLNNAQKYGEFINIKIENMQIQHKEIFEKQKKKIGYIAVAQGDGFISLFKDFGCDIVINGGQTMNTSAEEFIEAYKDINAESIIVLPNNKNTFLAAKQAKDIINNDNVYILETKSLSEGYFALSMSDTNDEDIDVLNQIENMKKGLENVNTISVCRSIKDTIINNCKISEGDYISFLDDDYLLSGSNALDLAFESLKKVPNIDQKEIIIVFKGQCVDDDSAYDLLDKIEENYSNSQSDIIDTKQDVYEYIIGVS